MACYHAALNGNLQMLQSARIRGCPWDKRVCAAAAKLDRLDILEWAHENGCPWDGETCISAVRGGHLHVLKWLRARGCPWNLWVCYYAASQGNIDILRWAMFNGCPSSKQIVRMAVVELLRHARREVVNARTHVKLSFDSLVWLRRQSAGIETFPPQVAQWIDNVDAGLQSTGMCNDVLSLIQEYIVLH